ncbi:MAG: prepilin-type N-terminal cleavage/methylation domain-containing protein [Verrucomicrobia bacterium]|nr:prepilin-type N-terminal cleavage/methylation domain-containing protein [Verrucomicrobiota bacterium]
MKPVTRPSFRHAAGGFTLLELLAAVAILAILSMLLFAAFNEASRAWMFAEGRVETSQQARAAFEMFNRELSGAILSTNPPLQKMKIIQGRSSGSDVWVSFLASPVDSRTNDPQRDVIVTYQRVASSNGLYSLCRTIDEQGYQGGVFRRLTADPVADVLVENVVDMVISNTEDGVTWRSGPWVGNTRNPLAVSLTITLIDSRAATRIAVAAGGAGRNDILRAASQTHHAKVFLPTHY